MRGAAKTRSHGKRDEAPSPRRRVSLGGEVVPPIGVMEKCTPTHGHGLLERCVVRLLDGIVGET